MNDIVKICGFITLSSMPLAISWFIRNKYKNERQQIQNIQPGDKYYHECLFFTMKNFKCQEHLYNRTACGQECSLSYVKRIIKFISSSKESIKLCIYMLTLQDVTESLVKAHKRGVNVKVITDKAMLGNKACKHLILKENGIPVKIQSNSSDMMHHKFCLIDDKDEKLGKLFFGTLNLTTQGLSSNFDVILFTNNMNIIEKFSNEFEELWENFLNI